MAYTPSLSDIPEQGFQPSLADIPSAPMNQGSPQNQPEMVDTFLGKMPKPSGDWREDLHRLGVLGFPRTPEEKAQQDQILHDRRLGMAQSLANYPIEIVNLFKKNPLSKFDFAPKNQDAQTGAMAGDLASFFMPGGAVKGVLKGLEYAPMIGRGVNALTKYVEASPFLRGATSVGRGAGEAGLFSATRDPENAGMAGAEGAGIGGATQLATNLLMTQNPIVRMLAKMGLGGLIGQTVGHPYYGALAATGVPQLGRMLGLGGRNAIAQDALEGLNYKDVARATSANERLGTTVTPGQASGNYVTAGMEGGLKRSPQGAQYAYRQEQSQLRQQGNAINRMLDNIYQPTAVNEATINALYSKANQMSINPNVVEQMKQNPIVSSAFKTVKSDPAFTQIPENNYEFLAEVDRQLYRDHQAALGTRPNSANAIASVKSSFNNFLKQANPDYDAATRAAQPKMVRQSIENRFNKMEEDMTGKNFYNKFLNTRSSYQNLLKDTKNFPEAQQAIKDMRQGWKYLSNIKTPSQAEAQSKTGLSHARDQLKAVMEAMQRYTGAKNDIKALKYVYTPGWEKDFDRIMQIKDQKMRNRELASYLGKLGIAYGMDKD